MMNFLGIYSDDIRFVDALIPSLIAIVIVFIVLFIIMGSTYLLKKIDKKNNEEELDYEQTPVSENVQSKKFTIEDITDEDMMVAVLVATIDYASETKKDVRLVSIKQIQ